MAPSGTMTRWSNSQTIPAAVLPAISLPANFQPRLGFVALGVGLVVLAAAGML